MAQHCKNCKYSILVNSCGAKVYYCSKRPNEKQTNSIVNAKYEKVKCLGVCKEHKAR